MSVSVLSAVSITSVFPGLPAYSFKWIGLQTIFNGYAFFLQDQESIDFQVNGYSLTENNFAIFIYVPFPSPGSKLFP